ncbi:MAG: hypothetical protein A3K19_14905 [Lentisphaerae bacterium RIFOXYB12_FULL_65_16]|nr:MAG: hypothetical protein A3K18_27465 [Lentisphaerae bacterium RIFOXYA12_64_32]OGV85913.1 MAG: hypothetical protein A3K19_14905 [Lentisphaerae bacterium RIFOXYB12_FULL_65_16]
MSIPCDPELVENLRCRTRSIGTSPIGGFAFDVDLSVPWLAVAVHAGHRVRDELLPLMQITEAQRLFEEDPATDQMIQGCPNAVWGLDSRAEYDLNRAADLAVPLTPERFWGVQVYREQPTPEMVRRSLDKFEAFYRFVASCIHIIHERFGVCAVYDIHSYNTTRQVAKGFDPPPVFNLGTAFLDRKRWGPVIEQWLSRLGQVEVPGVTVTVAENLVFSGQGEFCRCLTHWHPDMLVLPTEVAKVYMDERQGTLYPGTVDALRRGLQAAMLRHAEAFRAGR